MARRRGFLYGGNPNAGYYPDSMDRAFAQVQALANQIEQQKRNDASMALQAVKARQTLYPNATVSDQGQLADLAEKLKSAFGMDIVPKQTEQGLAQGMGEILQTGAAPATPGLTDAGGTPINAVSMADAMAAQDRGTAAMRGLPQAGQYLPIEPKMEEIYTSEGGKMVPMGKLPAGAHYVKPERENMGTLLLDAAGKPVMDPRTGQPMIVKSKVHQLRQPREETTDVIYPSDYEPPEGQPQVLPKGQRARFAPRGGGDTDLNTLKRMGIEETPENLQMIKELKRAPKSVKDEDVSMWNKAGDQAIRMVPDTVIEPADRMKVMRENQETIYNEMKSRSGKSKSKGGGAFAPQGPRPYWATDASNLPPGKR